MRLGLVHNMMVISPDRTLRNQSLNKTKTLECLNRYNINARVKTYLVDRAPKISRLLEDHIIAITTHMAKNHLATLQH